MDTNDTTKQTKRSRLAYFLRAFGYFVVLALVNFVAYSAVTDGLSSSLPSWAAFLAGNLVYLFGVVGLTWAFCHYLDHTSLRSLGLQRHRWLRNVGTGWALGAVLQLLIFVAFAALGWLTVERAPWQPLELAASVVSWLIISFNEELAFRGYIMQRLSQAWGMPAAVVASSLIFAMVHMFNPNFRPLAMLSLFAAGLLLACAYLVSRSLWLPIGVHLGWNLMEMQILGFPGSGVPEPAILRASVTGPEVMTGGAFGPEGGVLGIVFPLIGIALLLVWYRIALARQRQNLSGGTNER